MMTMMMMILINLMVFFSRAEAVELKKFTMGQAALVLSIFWLGASKWGVQTRVIRRGGEFRGGSDWVDSQYPQQFCRN